MPATQRAIAFLQPGWADWEAGPVLANLRAEFGVEVRAATPDGRPQLSIGGLTAAADAAFADVSADDAEIFLAIGSGAWREFHDERFFGLLNEAVERGKVVGAICAGTLAPARAGLFATRAHTSNGRDWIAGAAPGYAGSEHYVDLPKAVTGGRVVSAPGTAPNTFCSAICRLAFPDQEETIAGEEAVMRLEWADR